jgi:hypothetical protein
MPSVLDLIQNLFVSNSKRQQLAEGDRRMAELKARQVVAETTRRIENAVKEQHAERSKAWNESAVAFKSGNEPLAKSKLQLVQVFDNILANLQRQYNVFIIAKAQLSVGSLSADIGRALDVLTSMATAKPAELTEVFARLNGKLEEARMAGDPFAAQYQAMIGSADVMREDHVASPDQLLTQLKAQVAAELGSGTTLPSPSANTDAIGAANERLRKLSDGK